MGIGVTLLTWETFASCFLPISSDSTGGLCSQWWSVSIRRCSKAFTKCKVIAPACHFGLFITPDKQEKEGAALLAEVSSPDDHEKVGLLLMIGIGRHV